MTHILSVANQKGGVGKTTTVFNMADALSREGYKTLVIDNDPQANLSSYACADTEKIKTTIDEIYLSKSTAGVGYEQLVELNKNLFLLASDTMLSGVEYYLVSRSNRESILKNAIQDIKNDFQFIIIDNPPSLNLLTLNGLVASDFVVVPIQPEFFSLEGLSQLQSTIDELKKWHKIELLGLIPNMFDERRRLNTDVLKTLQETYGDKVFKTRIHNSVKVAESAGFGKSVIEYSPRSRSANEYKDLAKEILEHLKV